MSYSIKVNGRSHTVDVPGDTPLLWALRDTLELTGTKYGCGVAQCGACTVHLDGQPLRACAMPVSAVGTAEITTIEVAKIERDMIARGIFTSTADLRRKLMQYIRQHNKTCQPIQWAYSNPTHRIRAS
jgi:aerobic-type carbon monoxide dehydrogenase small subunit (CoxS/CutS family)